MRGQIAAIVVALWLVAPGARAQPSPPPTDFDFLDGTWSFVETFKNGGPAGQASVNGRRTGHKAADGSVLVDEFRVFGPGGETWTRDAIKIEATRTVK